MVDLRPVRRERVSARHAAAAQGVTASAQLLNTESARNLIITPREWQREAWQYYKSLGEFRYAVSDWLGNCMSRVRLVAATARPNETPQPITDESDPAFQLVGELAGDIGGQAAMMKTFAVHLSVPGESYLVGEDTDVGRDWRVCSSAEIRVKSRAPLTYEIMMSEGEWRLISESSLVVRIWIPDEEVSWRATSPAEAALPIMREVDYYNRYVIAILLSRLALNGLLLIPNEVSFPVKEQFKNQADPFVAELIDIASRSIANPGSASAALPLPLRVPAESVEKFRHLTFDTQMGEKVIEDRDRALVRLAKAINIPAEILTGVGDMNHWGQWQLEETAIKIHISPPAEIICRGLTLGYLLPMLKANGLQTTALDGGKYVVWYDTSELAQTPDRGGAAIELYDRGELSGEELRREKGFEDDEAPTDEAFKEMALKKIALQGGDAGLKALAALTGDESLAPPPPEPPAPPGDAAAPAEQPTDQGPPDTRPTSPPPAPPPR